MGLMSSWSARAKKAIEHGLASPASYLRETSELPDAEDGVPKRRGSLAPRSPSARKKSGVTRLEELEDEAMAQRMTWEIICNSDEFRGRWVALDECRYDEETGRATEGSVVDADDDLVELCARIRESERKNCAILFCGEDDTH
jgi:hypothetical protein